METRDEVDVVYLGGRGERKEGRSLLFCCCLAKIDGKMRKRKGGALNKNDSTYQQEEELQLGIDRRQVRPC